MPQVLVMNNNHCVNMMPCGCFSPKKTFVFLFIFYQHNMKIQQKTYLERLAQLLKMRMARYPNKQQRYM